MGLPGVPELTPMNDRALIRTGALGAALAAICCTTPLLAVVLGAVGLAAWTTNEDDTLIPILLLSLGLLGLGLYRRRRRGPVMSEGAQAGLAHAERAIPTSPLKKKARHEH